MSDDITLLLAIVQQNKYTVFRDIQQSPLRILYMMLYNTRPPDIRPTTAEDQSL